MTEIFDKLDEKSLVLEVVYASTTPVFTPNNAAINGLMETVSRSTLSICEVLLENGFGSFDRKSRKRSRRTYLWRCSEPIG